MCRSARPHIAVVSRQVRFGRRGPVATYRGSNLLDDYETSSIAMHMPEPGSDTIDGNGESPTASDTPRFYVGAYALCFEKGQMLLTRIAPGDSDEGKWTLPGGGVNWGEAPEQAALRELWEETGLHGRIAQVAGVFSATYLRSAERPRDSVHHIGIVYFAEVAPGELRDEQHGSTDRCAWIPREQLTDLPLVALAKFGADIAANHR